MGNEVKTKKIFFMRHGAILGENLSYEKMDYEEYMGYLVGTRNEPLKATDGFSLSSLFQKIMRQKNLNSTEKELRRYQIYNPPCDIDAIFHSPSARTRHTAKLIKNCLPRKVYIGASQKINLAEVKFSENILTEEEFKKGRGLKGCRSLILQRWFDGTNKESIKDSINRLKKVVEYVLYKTPYENVLLVTHGWYMRIVYLYLEGLSINMKNLTKAPIAGYGQIFEYNIQLNGVSTVVKPPKNDKKVVLDLTIEKN